MQPEAQRALPPDRPEPEQPHVPHRAMPAQTRLGPAPFWWRQHSAPPPYVTPTYLANFTEVAFRGTKPVWNWTWNIFMDATCTEHAGHA